MIIYFTSTRNCEFVAQRLADATNDKIVSMTTALDEIKLKDGENLGFVTPTYYWGLPSYVDDFMNRIKLIGAENSYIYYIATYGTTCGQTGTFMKQHLESKNLKISSYYSVKMPDDWTPVFNLSNKEKVANINQNEIPQIEEIIKHVISHDKDDFMKAKAPMFAVKVWKPNYEKDRRTSHLHVEDSCIGCGICAKNCPVQAIQMKDKKPVWVKEQCVMCLKCLHHCPKFAIQYANRTQKHGQYVHP